MELHLKRVASPFVFELENAQNQICKIDASSSIGGQGNGFRPMELLAGSLASCASIDVILILQKQRILLGDYEVKIIANRAEGVPSPFETIELNFYFFNRIEEEKLHKVIALTLEKYCSVSACLNDQIKISYKIHFVE